MAMRPMINMKPAVHGDWTCDWVAALKLDIA